MGLIAIVAASALTVGYIVGRLVGNRETEKWRRRFREFERYFDDHPPQSHD